MRGAICPSRRARGSARRARPPAPRRHEWCSPARASRRRQPDHEPRAGNGRLAVAIERTRPVLGPDAAAMGFDDLLGNRQPETGVLAKSLMRAIGVEALEDFLQRVGANTRAIVVD